MKISRGQALCLITGAVFSAAVFLRGEDFILTDSSGSYMIERPDIGEADKSYDVLCETENGNEKIKISVSPRKYTAEEAEILFEKMIGPATAAMLSDNAGIDCVTGDLSFISGLDGFPGIAVSWKTDDPVHIGMGGEIYNEDISEPETALLTVTFSTDAAARSYEIPVLICPVTGNSLSGPAESGIEDMLRKADKDSETEKYMVLPQAVNGSRVKYREPADASPLVLLLMGAAAAFLLGLKPAEEEKKKKKSRETELLMDYSDIVSKLIVYIGAGLTIRNAWEKLADEPYAESRAAYREITVSAAELKNGETENRVYLRFAKRCGLRCYTRLASLLDQNSKTGDEALLNALELEMGEAFEQRKNTARRLGEEAGTKLILPLMMQLITVLIIVVSPALFTMI